jgi:hypothetical protein
MRQVYLRVLGCLLAALLLMTAACGGSNAPKAQSQSGGFTSYSSSEGDFSISVPSDWKAFSDDALSGEALSDFVKENPQFAGIEKERYSFLAADPDAEAPAPSVNVFVQEVPDDARIEDAVPAFVSQTKALSDTPETVRHELIELDAGRTLLIESTVNVASAGITTSLAARQYFVISGGRLFVITYGAGLGDFERYEADFERSAESFDPKP